ncbi:MAG: 30S ribosomal protein S11 [Deferribacteraceae bacterium]|jgi:small subunit ribosomal protein S11|nr:30S ribosomal protein S11 [Deferribacteraceae bacterium]
MAQAKRSTKKEKKIVPRAIAHVSSTFNNTHVTFSDLKGNVICWATGGSGGAGGAQSFKNSRKSTPFAAQLAADSAAKKAKEAGVLEVEVSIKGPGSGRESAVRAIQAAGISVTAIKDITPIPHNGCRPRKRRRI